MKKVVLAVVAAALGITPVSAHDFDWWLVNGGPGASSIDFVDVASINENGSDLSFNVATYWRNGNVEQRHLTMHCSSKLSDSRAIDLQNFVCGSSEQRMESGMIVDASSMDWIARIVFNSPG